MNRRRILEDELRALLGDDGVDTGRAARRVYARDASHLLLGEPRLVALPSSPGQVGPVVAACAAAGVPVVCRGTGTGLSGGAVPPEGAVVLALARLDGLGEVDASGGSVHAGPGALNTAVSKHARPHGLHFAPDPSSQAAASVGGNIAENAGGPHCLAHGVTLHHLRRLDWVDARGRAWSTGRGRPFERGIDLTSLLCGSEGTLGVVTGAELGLVPDPDSVATLLCFFPRLEDAAGSVPVLLGAGLSPVAMEIVDQAMLVAVEQAFAFGFPTDRAAAMIVEFAGSESRTVDDADRARELLSAHGADEIRVAADEDERHRLWQCRKRAFGAVGRLSPSYVTMDVVVPLGQLAPLVHEIQRIKDQHGVHVATAFHAGDGNLHPGVHYDDRDPEATRRAHAAADAIIESALARRGSISGEHGVGIEKLHALPWQIDAEAARLMFGIKRLFDPGEILNPGKLLPPDAGSWAEPPPRPDTVTVDRAGLVLSAPADTSLLEAQREAAAMGFWLPCGLPLAIDPEHSLTLGDLVARQAPWPPCLGGAVMRDILLEVWGETGDGRPFHAGAPVFKNVAGLDLVHLLCGSEGVLARVTAVTVQLRPAPGLVRRQRWRHPGGTGAAAGADAALRRLARRSGPRHGATVLGAGGVGTEAVLDILAPLADRGWDRADLDAALEPLTAAGWRPDSVEGVRFAAAIRAGGSFAPDLWAGRVHDWDVASRADVGEAVGGRWLWHARPRTLWLPADGTATGSGGREPYLRDGRPAPLPPPAPAVPREYLRGLKDLFDPHRSLPTVDWLEEGADG